MNDANHMNCMNYKFLEASNLDDAWFQAVLTVMTEGNSHIIDAGSYEKEQERREMGLTIKILNPWAEPIFPQMPPGSGIPAPTSLETIQDYFAVYLMSDVKQPNEHYTYGEDLHWQVAWVIKHYKEAGHHNNHCYMTVGRPETVYFYDPTVDYSEKIILKDRKSKKILQKRVISNEWNKNGKGTSQCLRGIDTWIEKGRLHFSPTFRSWDLWSGFPTNLGGIQLLKKYMADEIGVEDGGMIVHCPKIHVYESTWKIALMRIKKGEEILSK